jgi:hypothetical protein
MRVLFESIQGIFLSMKTTIFLLITLALVSIIRTLIPQQKEAAQYIAQYGLVLYRFFDLIGLLDLYASWWFRLLLVLLLINLVTCSLKQLPEVTVRCKKFEMNYYPESGVPMEYRTYFFVLLASQIQSERRKKR